VPMIWYGEQIKAKLHDHAAERVEYAARMLQNYLRRKLLAHRSPPSSAPGAWPHYRLGHLARNVQMEFDRATCTARVGTNVPYGKWLEFGTRKMRSRPWLSRGVRERRSAIKRVLTHRMAA